MEHVLEEEKDADSRRDGKNVDRRFPFAAVNQQQGEDDYRRNDKAQIDNHGRVDAEAQNHQNAGLFHGPIKFEFLFLLEDKTLNQQSRRTDQHTHQADSRDNAGTGRAGVESRDADLAGENQQHDDTEHSHNDA